MELYIIVLLVILIIKISYYPSSTGFRTVSPSFPKNRPNKECYRKQEPTTKTAPPKSVPIRHTTGERSRKAPAPSEPINRPQKKNEVLSMSQAENKAIEEIYNHIVELKNKYKHKTENTMITTDNMLVLHGKTSALIDLEIWLCENYKGWK